MKRVCSCSPTLTRIYRDSFFSHFFLFSFLLLLTNAFAICNAVVDAGGFGGTVASAPSRIASLKRPEDSSVDDAGIPLRQQSPFRSLSP